MADQEFTPPRRRGILTLTGLALLLLAGSAAALQAGLAQGEGGYLVLLLLFSLAIFTPGLILLYRAWSLWRSSYTIDREGLRLRWGLRAEDIPIYAVEWVRPASDLGFHLPRPPLALPGAVLGVMNVEGLGPVEFMASDFSSLLLVATPARVYALSPADSRTFMRVFQRTVELGSLQPIESYSTRPAAYLARVLQDRAARVLLGGGFAVVVLHFIAVALTLPGMTQVGLGFGPDGAKLPPVPAVQLLLLPVLASFAYAADTAAGLFFYRLEQRRPIAYLLWLCGLLTPLLFMAGVVFMV